MQWFKLVPVARKLPVSLVYNILQCTYNILTMYIVTRLIQCLISAPKTILHSSSGIIEGGKLTAIMGSSGAGKTTMMNILAQRNLGGLQIEGTLRANGQPYDYKIGNISSYVQQDDIFVGSLTVKGTDLQSVYLAPSIYLK